MGCCFKRLIAQDAPEKRLVRLGRMLTIVFVIIGCFTAPFLTDGVFQFIQQFQGFIWPGIVAAFLGAFLLPRAPAFAGVTALLMGPILYSLFQTLTGQGLFAGVLAEPVFELNFLMQVFWCFVIIFVTMIVLTLIKPLPKPVTLPVREEMDLRTEPAVFIAGGAVILGVIAFFITFW